MALIGYICLHWALLEMMLLGIISAIENIPKEKANIIYGGLDMLPRCGMAINLARHARLPGPTIARIEAIRKALQGTDGIAARRNQAVHGVHSASPLPAHVRLTMVRWKGEKLTQEISVQNMYDLGMANAAMGIEAGKIFDDYGAWKFGDHRPENRDGEEIQPESSIRLKIAQHINACVDHFRRWIKG